MRMYSFFCRCVFTVHGFTKPKKSGIVFANYNILFLYNRHYELEVDKLKQILESEPWINIYGWLNIAYWICIIGTEINPIEHTFYFICIFRNAQHKYICSALQFYTDPQRHGRTYVSHYVPRWIGAVRAAAPNPLPLNQSYLSFSARHTAVWMHVAVPHSRFLIELLVIGSLYVTVVITQKFLF